MDDPTKLPLPTLSADAEPAHQRIVQLNVTNMQYKYVLPKTKKQDLELLLDQNDFFCWKKMLSSDNAANFILDCLELALFADCS